MALPALTHHEIIEIVEPFSRHGWRVDLTACDRAARKIVFKPVDRLLDGPAAASLREILTLHCGGERHFVLDRTLVHPGGAQASLQAGGPQPAALLAAVEAIDPARHFVAGPGFLLARSYEFWSGRSTQPLPLAASSLFMTLAVVALDGLTLKVALRMPDLRSVPADITLTPAPGTRYDLPEDLLAVLGWDWARLVHNPNSWTSKLRLRGNALRRSRTAEVAVERAARHLVSNFGERPARFHERHWLARWGVVFRRGIPTLTAVAMIGGALALARYGDHAQSGVWMALHYLPIGLLAFAFSLQELPQFEIPPLPRRSAAPGWRAPADDPVA